MSRIESRRLLSARVAHDDVEAAKPLTASATSFWQNVSSRRSPGIATPMRPSALISAMTSCASGSSVGKVVDGDVRAFARVGDGSRASHAGIAAGDQRLASREPARAAITRLAVIRLGIHLAGIPINQSNAPLPKPISASLCFDCMDNSPGFRGFPNDCDQRADEPSRSSAKSLSSGELDPAIRSPISCAARKLKVMPLPP